MHPQSTIVISSGWGQCSHPDNVPAREGNMWFGIIGGLGGLLVGAFVFNGAVTRGGLCGLAIGLALAFVVNVIVPTPAVCLQQSKGFDILRTLTFC